MNPVSPVPIFIVMLLALITSHLLARRFTLKPVADRATTIDGLRGYLGVSVFLHHACTWYFFLRTGNWDLPPSQIYSHLGQTAVVLFFMITGFLFFSKVIAANKRPIDWTHLYISRVFRLLPLYLFAMAGMVLVVAVLSSWQMHEPPTLIARSVAHWMAFTWIDHPAVNGVALTGLITAGATWTLRYEWVFYWMLPLLAWVAASRPPVKYLALGIAAVIAIQWLHLSWLVMAAFMGGISAAVLVQFESVRNLAARTLTALLVIACIGAVVMLFPSPYTLRPLLLLSIAFILIAGGNTLFGLLTHSTSRSLGDLTYSVYLLHGILLFSVFRFGFGLSEAASISAAQHWAVIALCTPVLVSISFFTFRHIELPGMRMAPHVTHWIGGRLTPVPQQAPAHPG